MAEVPGLRFANEYVEFYLPLGWTVAEVATYNTPAVYISENGKARLTLSYQFYDANVPRAELKEIFDAFFRVRIKGEREHLTRSDVIESSETNYDDESVWRSFAGKERAANRRFNGLVAAENGKLLTFYIESSDEPQEEHNNLVQLVLGSVLIK